MIASVSIENKQGYSLGSLFSSESLELYRSGRVLQAPKLGQSKVCKYKVGNEDLVGSSNQN
jgi:hypothetical protein